MKTYGQEEINNLKEAMETGAKPQGALPNEAANMGGATHLEGEHYRTPKEKMAAAIKDYADESTGKERPKKPTKG